MRNSGQKGGDISVIRRSFLTLETGDRSEMAMFRKLNPLGLLIQFFNTFTQSRVQSCAQGHAVKNSYLESRGEDSS